MPCAVSQTVSMLAGRQLTHAADSAEPDCTHESRFTTLTRVASWKVPAALRLHRVKTTFCLHRLRKPAWFEFGHLVWISDGLPTVRMLKLAGSSVNSIMPPLAPPALDRLALTETAEAEVPAEDEQWTEVRRRKSGRFVTPPRSLLAP